MRPLYGIIGLILNALIATPIGAEVRLNDTRVWKRARLVAPSQQVWAVQTSYQRTRDRFSAQGEREGLGENLSRSVTWGELIANESTAQAQDELRAQMFERGNSEADVVATTSYRVEREDLGLGLEWAYGITRSWMIGFQMPFALRTTRVSTEVSGASPEARARAALAAEQQLAEAGYDGVLSQDSQWIWSDLTLLSQTSLINSANWTWSLQQMVRIPAARSPSVTDYFRDQSDDGNFDLGLTSLVDYRWRRFTLGAQLGYIAQLPDQIKTRVPSTTTAENESIDNSVRRDLGDWYFAAFDTDYRLSSRWTMHVEQSLLIKNQDRYSAGDRIPNAQYAKLSQGTEQELHQTRFGVLYQIGANEIRDRVENKWVASVGYVQPWLGRNTADAGRANIQIINYF